MSLSFTYSILLLIAAVLLAAAGSYWVYRNTVPALSAGRRAFLGLLRFGALALVLFLLAEPLVRRISSVTEEPILALLFDESESMSLSQADSSEGVTNRNLSEVLREVQAATVSERTRIFGFGSSPREVPGLDSLHFVQSRTDVSSGLDFVRATLENEPLGAVLLVSDGRHNEGRNPEYVADLYPVPVLSYVVGDTTVRKDIRIQQVLRNEISYVGREVPVRVRIRNEGFSPSRIRIDLSTESEDLARENVMLPPSGSEMEVEMTFVPDSVGLFQYRVDITRLQGEFTHRNNTESFPLQVLERERRVLVLAGGPSPDVSTVRQMLEEDSDTKVTLRTLKGTADGSYYEGSWPLAEEDPDLLILIGYPGAAAPGADVARIGALAENGTPVLFLMDRSVSLPRLQSELSTVLPARPSVIRPGYLEGSFEPTEAAGRHAIFDITDRRNIQDWLRLPPLALGQTRWETSPGATVLATSRIRGISIDDPVLVVGRIGNRRSGALLASGFWKWSNAPADLQRVALRWKELFSNLVLWLVTEDDDRLVRVAPQQSVLDESEPVVFGGQVYDENLQPLSNVSLTLRVRHPNGEVFPYTLQSVGNGQYRAGLGSFPAGSYRYEAVAETDEGELGRDRGQFTVGSLSLEFRNPYADRTLMRRVAQRSGGTLLDPAGLSDLRGVLSGLPEYKPVTRETENQLRLWRYIPFGVLILILMTAEWFFRKRFGLV